MLKGDNVVDGTVSKIRFSVQQVGVAGFLLLLVLFKFRTNNDFSSHCLLLLLIYTKKEKKITRIVVLQREVKFKVNFR